MSEKRHFRLTDPLIVKKKVKGKAENQDDKHGSFYSTTPSGAAKKAFNAIFSSLLLENKNKNGKVEHFVFSIREATQGSAKKEYTYVGEGKVLKPPKIVVIKGQKIKYDKETRVIKFFIKMGKFKRKIENLTMDKVEQLLKK